jgi:hypothetical protein
MRQYKATTLAVSSRRFLETEEKDLKIKASRIKLRTLFPLLKPTRCCRSVKKNVTQQRMDEDEETPGD